MILCKYNDHTRFSDTLTSARPRGDLLHYHLLGPAFKITIEVQQMLIHKKCLISLLASYICVDKRSNVYTVNTLCLRMVKQNNLTALDYDESSLDTYKF